MVWMKHKDLLKHIRVCAVELNETGDLVVTELSQDEHEANPTFFSLACFNPRNRAFLENLATAPEYRQYFANASVHQVPEAPLELAAGLFAAASSYIAPLVRFSSEQALALSALRREYERVHLRFSALESHMQSLGTGSVRERLFIPPDRTRIGEAALADVSGGRFRQVLPVSSKGLCCLDVYVRFKAGETGAQLRAALFIGDAREPEVSWVVSPSPAAPAEGRWYSLTLNRSLEGVPRTVALELDASTAKGSSVFVAVGGLLANGAYCLRDLTDEHAVGSRPLAMRLWEAPPGLLVPRAGNLTLCEPRLDIQPATVRLPATSLQHVRELPNGDWKPDFRPVGFIEAEDCIGVHPPHEGVCSAVLDDVVPRGALSVSATAFVAHDASAPVEFALAVTEAIVDRDLPWEFAPDARVLAWSGWRAVMPPERQQLTVPLGPEIESTGGPLSLVMLTRMKDGALNSFAWARFADVIVEAAS